jgi:hypothetical protein
MEENAYKVLVQSGSNTGMIFTEIRRESVDSLVQHTDK